MLNLAACAARPLECLQRADRLGTRSGRWPPRRSATRSLSERTQVRADAVMDAYLRADHCDVFGEACSDCCVRA
jgi:hypothetical protein